MHALCNSVPRFFSLHNSPSTRLLIASIYLDNLSIHRHVFGRSPSFLQRLRWPAGAMPCFSSKHWLWCVRQEKQEWVFFLTFFLLNVFSLYQISKPRKSNKAIRLPLHKSKVPSRKRSESKNFSFFESKTTNHLYLFCNHLFSFSPLTSKQTSGPRPPPPNPLLQHFRQDSATPALRSKSCLLKTERLGLWRLPRVLSVPTPRWDIEMCSWEVRMREVLFSIGVLSVITSKCNARRGESRGEKRLMMW